MPFPSSASGLSWPKLTSGILVKRYKRFLADVMLQDGETITVHCPNSGKMTSCCEPGRTVYLSVSDNPKRHFPCTWEMISMPTSLVCVNTLQTNKLVRGAIANGLIEELAAYDKIYSEVRCGASSRLDLLLQRSDADRCFVEVKSCTLVEDGIAYFPDAVTTRGRKHLIELQHQAHLGNRAVIFFLVQRTDSTVFRPADRIDPAYGSELRSAAKNGVEILCYDVALNLKHMALNRPIPYEL
jgi:sugar fermentation stimulation protein A